MDPKLITTYSSRQRKQVPLWACLAVALASATHHMSASTDAVPGASPTPEPMRTVDLLAESEIYTTIYQTSICAASNPGAVLAAGDFDNNGFGDIAFSATNTPSNSTTCPPVTVIFQGDNRSWTISVPIRWTSGEIKLGRHLHTVETPQGPDTLIIAAPEYSATSASGCGSTGASAPCEGAMFNVKLPQTPIGMGCELGSALNECPYVQYTGSSGDFLGKYAIGTLDTQSTGIPYQVMGSTGTVGSGVLFITVDTLQSRTRLSGDGEEVYSLLGNLFLTEADSTIQQAFISDEKYGWVCDQDDLGSLSIWEDCQKVDAFGEDQVSTAIAINDTTSLVATIEPSAPYGSVYLLEAGRTLATSSVPSSPPQSGYSPTFGTALAALGPDKESLLLLAASAPSAGQSDSDVYIFQRLKNNAWTAVLKYHDDHDIKLGTALAAVPGWCPVAWLSEPASGLVISVPVENELAGILPSILLVCPVDSINVDGDGYVLADDCDDQDVSVYPGAKESCDGNDNDCNPATDETQDSDGDGYPSCLNGVPSDCKDTDPSVYPGAEEACNNVDDDCDGTPDDGASMITWYRDGDGDGYGCQVGQLGTLCLTQAKCQKPSGYVSNSADCNDGNPAVHPGAVEICGDTIDNNCDGSTDQVDSDGDGHVSSTCGGDDCDDTDDDIYPGQSEICKNGKNDDCVGTADDGGDSDLDGVPDCSDTEACDSKDNDGDGVVDEGFDLDDDGYTPCGAPDRPGDCNDADPGIHPNAVETCDSIDNNCTQGIDEGYDKDHDGSTTCGPDGVDDNPADGPSDDDCDDMDPSVYPGHEEICDGIDENCNNLIDDGLIDADGDSYTACNSTTTTDGTLVGFDCDDHNADINPAVNEVCNGIDDNCIDGTDENFDLNENGMPDCSDGDNDGYTDADVSGSTIDCNDYDASVNPGQTESCDGRDENCNEQIDDGLLDADDDSYPPCETTTDEDGNLVGFDCNDHNPDIKPSAEELCNEIDDNCNGEVDEAVNNADDEGSAGDTKAPDNDQDDDGIADCTDQDDDGFPEHDPEDEVTDCDDFDDAVHPDQIEGCDGVDQDCDGLIDEDFDRDGDTYTTCDTAAGPDDCDDTRSSIYPGAQEECNGLDDDCDGVIDDDDYGDLDKDGDGTRDCVDDDLDGFCEGSQCIERGDGKLPEPGDCDDRDGDRSPDGEEIGCNGKDEDCSCMERNQSRCSDAELADGVDEDGTGGLDCKDDDGDGYTEEDISADCNDAARSINPQAQEVCDGVDNDCDGYTDEAAGLCLTAGCSVSPAGGSTTRSGLIMIAGLAAALGRVASRRRRPSAAKRRSPAPLLIWFVLLVLGAPEPVYAGSCGSAWNAELLKSRLASIRSHLQAGDYDEAFDEATDARDKMQCLETPVSPAAVARLPLALGTVSWYANRHDDARKWFREAVSIDPRIELDAESPLGMKTLLGEEKSRRAKLKEIKLVTVNRAMLVRIDGVALEESLRVAPGPHIVQMLRSDRTVCTWWLEVPPLEVGPLGRGVRFKDDVGPLPGCSERPVLGAPPWPRSRYGMVVTGAALVLTTASLISLQTEYTALKRDAARDVRCPDDSDTEAACARYHRRFIASWAALGASAIAAGVTLTLYFDEQRKLELETRAGAGTADISMSVSF